MIIQHNIMALNAHRQLTANNASLQKNIEKLSSGFKINRAGDDASGLAISEKMRAQIAGLKVAQNNAQDGISLIQTAEGALTEVHSMLNRMVELIEKSANGTLDDGVDRKAIQKEVDDLLSEIDRISQATNFNGIKLLGGAGGAGGATYTPVAATWSDGVDATHATASYDLTGIVFVGDEAFTLAGENYTVPVGDATINGVFSAIQAAPPAGFTVSLDGNTITLQATTAGSGQTQPADFEYGSDTVSADWSDGVDAAPATAVYDLGGFDFSTGGTVTIGANEYTLAVDDDIDALRDAILADPPAGFDVSLSGTDLILTATVAGSGSTNPGDFEFEPAGGPSMFNLTLQIGDTNEDFQKVTVQIEDLSSSGLGIDGLVVDTQTAASDAIDTIKAAINKVSTNRANLGGLQNRLEHTINNLSVTEENMTAAESRIRDVDMAKEMMAYTKNNVLTQAAQAMLAQANMQPQSVLQLLR